MRTWRTQSWVNKDQKITIEKGEDGKAKIKLEGEPAERLLEQAGIIPQVAKAPVRVSGHKQYGEMQPQTSHISENTTRAAHGSDVEVNPNPDESPFNIGNVEENNFVASHTTSKSESDNESLCGICGRGADKHDRDSGHPLKGIVEKSQIESYISWITKGEPEKVPIEDVINWIKVMNPSQLQHAIDPNNWYEWSERVSRLTWDEMNEDQKRLLVATYAFRNDGKVVEGIENESMVPKDEGEPQSQSGNIGKTNLHPQANTSNINATPTPMTVGQNTKDPIDPVEDASTFERTQKALDSLRLTRLEIKLKNLKLPQSI